MGQIFFLVDNAAGICQLSCQHSHLILLPGLAMDVGRVGLGEKLFIGLPISWNILFGWRQWMLCPNQAQEMCWVFGTLLSGIWTVD